MGAAVDNIRRRQFLLFKFLIFFLGRVLPISLLIIYIEDLSQSLTRWGYYDDGVGWLLLICNLITPVLTYFTTISLSHVFPLCHLSSPFFLN